ncbi:MAG: lipoyl(octanoyl) transferase LipB [Bacteroidetes bacterium]|nr:lipoyl(octanoyl) transferase LipB [Bacteroidota bacterium]
MNVFDFEDWGIIEYGKARKKQLERFEKNIADKIAGKSINSCLIFCEHEPVITFGKSANKENMLFNREWLNKHGVAVYDTERGGDVTFHGYEQLVAYPHFDIETMGKGVRDYINSIEEVIIRTIAHYGITGIRSKGFTGVWLDVDTPLERKIAAIGVKCSRGITMHGLALNVNTDLHFFNFIVPCGIQGKGVTSIEKELNHKVPMDDVKSIMRKEFEKVFA